jgi:crooked neck
MMPIIGRKQHVDKETGQVVEGQRSAPSIAQLPDYSDIDWELVFADDEREANPRSFKFLQMAHAWKHSQAKKSGGTGILSGFTPATASAPESTQNDDVRMEDRREQDDSHSDVASSDGE